MEGCKSLEIHTNLHSFNKSMGKLRILIYTIIITGLVCTTLFAEDLILQNNNESMNDFAQ